MVELFSEAQNTLNGLVNEVRISFFSISIH
jgi:hypothetical protein